MVVEALLNNETYFFRDRAPFDVLQRYALPALFQSRAKTKRLRIWSAGCSTGQEAYSLSMLFAEEPEKWRGWTIDILGTDVSTSCVDRARNGTYTPVRGPARPRHQPDDQMVRGVPRRLARSRGASDARFASRSTIIFEQPPHPGGFDIVLCRNVLLYLSPEKKTLSFERLASAMARTAG